MGKLQKQMTELSMSSNFKFINKKYKISGKNGVP